MKYGYKRPLINDEKGLKQLQDMSYLEVWSENHPNMKKGTNWKNYL